MTSASSANGKDKSGNLWNFLGSMRLGIWLLVALSVLSFVALMIDGLAPIQLKQSQLFQLLQLSDPFRSFWFRLLLGLMGVSLVVCVINRGPGLLIAAFRRDYRVTRGYYERNDRTSHYAGDDALSRTEALCKCLHLSFATRKVEDGVAISASAGNISRLGPLLVHLGMIVLILGGLSTGLSGEKSRISGSPGDTLNFPNRGFDLLIKDFRIEYYPLSINQWVELENGMRGIVKNVLDDSVRVELSQAGEVISAIKVPQSTVRNDFLVSDGHTKAPYQGNIKSYITTAEVIRDNVALFTRDIKVNQPLRYRDLRLYQSSFRYMEGSVEIDSLVLILNTEEGKNVALTLAVENGSGLIPWNDDIIRVDGFYPDFRLDGAMKPFSASRQLNNPAARVTVVHPNGEAEEGWAFRGSFGNMGGHIGGYSAHLSDFVGNSNSESLYLTVLDVYRTPGTWLIWVGLLLSSLGLIIGYMTYQRQIWGLVDSNGSTPQVYLVWKCSRQTDHFSDRFKECWKKNFC